MSNTIKIAASIITLASFISVCFGVNAYFAKAEEVAMLERRLDQKIVQDQQNYLQEQLWKIEDRYRNREKSGDIIDRERRLKKQLKEAEEKLKQLRGK